MKKNKIAIVIILLLAVCVFLVSRFFEKEKGGSKEILSLDTYYSIPKNEAKLFINTEEREEKVYVKEKRAYISLELAKEYVKRLFYEEENKRLFFTDANTKTVYDFTSSTKTENGREAEDNNFPFLLHKKTVFVDMEFVKEKSGIAYHLSETPYRLMVFTETGEYEKAKLLKDGVLRADADSNSPILKELKEGDSAFLIKREEKKDFDYVLTDDGILGYLSKKNIDSYDEAKIEVARINQDETYKSIKHKEPIVLAWHQVFNENGNHAFDTVIKNTKNVNVISPTWFNIIREDGELESFASKAYVQKAHEKGFEVWAVVHDFKQDVDFYELFMKEKNRERLINNLVYFIDEFKLDGINIDFEAVKADYAEGFVQFLREFSIVMRDKKKVFSIDNYVPAPHTDFYDRKEQGIVADYICVMAYDEHYYGSKQAGSVSSVSWVKRGLDLTEEEVSPDKLIIGLPFYTRIWKEINNGGLETKALSMAQGIKKVKEAGAQATWDERTGQYYAEWKSGKDTYKIWLEEKRSLETKLNEVNKNKVAGIAFWKLGLENDNVWPVIENWVSN